MSYGIDSNAADVASPFVGITRPQGVKTGDLILIGISVPAGIQVTPPDDSWTQAAPRTDSTRPMGIVCYWQIAMNPPTQWVFALSAAAIVGGTVLVYRNADAFEPIEASAIALTAASAAHNVASISTSLPDEELALFIAADASGVFTAPAGLLGVTRKQQVAQTLEAQHGHRASAGAVASFTEAFSGGAVDGAAILIVIAPSVGTTSFDDARMAVQASLPPGIENLLHCAPGGDYYNLFSAIGALLKLYVFDAYDALRLEILPHLSRFMLREWERVLGLLATRAAQVGTIPQRQTQVLAAWRSIGQGSSIPAVQSVLGPLLGYFPTTPVQVLEADPTALRALQSYGLSQDIALPHGQTTTVTISVLRDRGKVSQAGVRLQLPFAQSDLTGYTFTLTAPDGTTKTWNRGWQRQPLVLYAIEMAGRRIRGEWKLAIFNGNGAVDNTLLGAPWLQVAGIGPDQDTGGAVFHWAVLEDGAHVNESGNALDTIAAKRAIDKMAFTHTVGALLTSIAPQPGTDSAVPGRFVPV